MGLCTRYVKTIVTAKPDITLGKNWKEKVRTKKNLPEMVKCLEGSFVL